MTGNEISFDCGRLVRHDVQQIVPRIDGTPLTALIDDFELGAGMTPAGDAYGGLIPAFYRFGPMDDHFHGLPAHAAAAANAARPKTAVLGCECGEVGCWPLMARITVTDDFVVWDSFEQPFRETRDYTAFGPFRFGRGRYDDALRALMSVVIDD